MMVAGNQYVQAMFQLIYDDLAVGKNTLGWFTIAVGLEAAVKGVMDIQLFHTFPITEMGSQLQLQSEFPDHMIDPTINLMR